jgi:signal transduction histidine kinase
VEVTHPQSTGKTRMHTSSSALIDALHACAEPAEPARRSVRAAANIAALGEMTHGIAHDFRNVLCMLTSGLNIAEANVGDPAKLGLALGAMQEGVARGLKLTNQLLAFARQQELKPGAEDINALLAALAPFLRYGAGPGIGVVLELGSDVPRCLVDPRQLNAAILNLVVNARDAMPDGGLIRISTAVAHRKRAGGSRDYVRVRVRDNGSGMPPNIVAKIFDPFFTTKGDRGSGLGVPQVQALMRQVSGYVAVKSKVGKGTAFDLFFPVPDQRPPVAPDVSQQLDRWADEGGAIGRAPATRQ